MSANIDTTGAGDGRGLRLGGGFGRAIRRVRRARGWTQADLASWLGANRQTVIKLEAGGSVSLPFAMKALSMLGGKAVIARKSQRFVEAADGDD